MAVTLVVAFAVVACGDDGGGTEDATRFCEIDREIEDLAEPTTPEEAEEFLTDFRELVAEGATVAPDEISDDVDALLDEVNDITADDLNAPSEEFTNAITSIVTWTEENCTAE